MAVRAVITPDTVARGYARSRALTAAHGRTYHLAATLLPRDNRFGVYALYGYARHVDDIVDGTVTTGTVDGTVATGVDDRLARLDVAVDTLGAALRGEPVPAAPADLVEITAALADTVARFDIDPATFDTFHTSMRMDLPGSTQFRSRYPTFDDLARYTAGSAAVIGEQMLPLLGVSSPTPEIVAGARALGNAFQLTNFLRDVAEDLDRDRIYLPGDELAAFGVDDDHLRHCHARRRTSPQLRRALAHLIAVNRSVYRTADEAIILLPNRTRPAIAAAAAMYEHILTEIEESDYDIMGRRAVVSRPRRLAIALGTALRTPRPVRAG